MAERVKPKRPYESPRRREQAAATRLEILEAAQRLFERDGYAATTMAAVAAEARVALKTVYIAFETKSGVLRALWNLRLRGGSGRLRSPSSGGTATCSRSPTPSVSCGSTRTTRARQAPDRRAARGDPQRRADRPRHRRALVPDPDRLPRQPARDRSELNNKAALGRRSTWSAPPTSSGRSTTQHLAATGPPARLDAEQYEQWCADTACAQLLEPQRRTQPAKCGS